MGDLISLIAQLTTHRPVLLLSSMSGVNRPSTDAPSVMAVAATAAATTEAPSQHEDPVPAEHRQHRADGAANDPQEPLVPRLGAVHRRANRAE